MARRSRGVERFRRALCAHGLEDTIAVFDDPARTADAAADALGCPTGAIVKSLVFAGPGGQPWLVLAAGDGRVAESVVAALVDGPVELGNAGFVRSVAGYAIGGVPPFGHVRALPTLVDRRIGDHATVWAAAGSPSALFSIPPETLVEVTDGRVVAVR